MAKQRAPPGSQQELYTVSVERVPQYKSRCCRGERLCKDLLCVTLIALAVICVAVAIFLIVFFLTTDPKSSAVAGNADNSTSQLAKLERQREEEANINDLGNIDNSTAEVVEIDIHHHGHGDHHHDHNHQTPPAYNIASSTEKTEPKTQPQEPEEPQAEPEPEPTSEPETNQDVKTPEVDSTTTEKIQTTVTVTESPVPKNRTSVTVSAVTQTSTTVPVTKEPGKQSESWKVVTESKTEATTRLTTPQPKTVTGSSTEPSLIVPPESIDNSPWKPITVQDPVIVTNPKESNTTTITEPKESISNQTIGSRVEVSNSTTAKPKEEQVIKITLDDALPETNVNSTKLFANETSFDVAKNESTARTVPEAEKTVISTLAPVRFPGSKQDVCVKRDLSLCKGILFYPETKYPNWVGDNNPVERNISLPFIESIIDSDCSPRVQQYMCAVLEPQCSNGVALPPCQKFCRAIAEGCKQHVLAALNLAKIFDCNLYPDSKDPNVCLNLAASGGEGECLEGEFHCSDNTCIPENWVCDGKKDCSDGDDELTCIACRDDEFRCETGNRCVPNNWRCDGSTDCKDGSDERNCNPEGGCEEGQFRCEDGLSCIPRRWVCDGSNHCRDNSDEKNCTSVACQNDDFKCRDSGVCIPRVWVCDNNWDCKDGSDEVSCTASDPNTQSAGSVPLIAANTTATDTKVCPLGELSCVAGNKCIRIEQLCDGNEDCDDGADEKDCREK